MNIIKKNRDLFKERDEIVRKVLKPIFKKAWFKVSWTTLRRETDDLYQRLTIQSSSWNYDESVSFYINIDSESKYYYKLNWKELPIKESAWGFLRANEIIWWEQSYTLDYNSSFQEFSKKIEKDMNLLINKYFDLSSLELYLLEIYLYENTNSFMMGENWMYLLFPLLKEDNEEWKKMLNNFFEHIKKIKYSSDYEDEIKIKMEKFIDIIENNKPIVLPKKEKYNYLHIGNSIQSLKKRKLVDAYKIVLDWFKNSNISYTFWDIITLTLCVKNNQKKMWKFFISDILHEKYWEWMYCWWVEWKEFWQRNYEWKININDLDKIIELTQDKENLQMFVKLKYQIKIDINFSFLKNDDNQPNSYFTLYLWNSSAISYSFSSYRLPGWKNKKTIIWYNDIVNKFKENIEEWLPFRIKDKDFWFWNI